MKSSFAPSKSGRYSGHCATAVLALITIAWPIAPAMAQDAPAATKPAENKPAQIQGTIDHVGNAAFSVEVVVPVGANLFDIIDKKPVISTDKVTELLEWHEPSRVVEEFKFSYDDATRRLNMTYTIPGYARRQDSGAWAVPVIGLPLHKLEEPGTPADRQLEDHVASFTGSMETSWGQQNANCQITLPADSKNVALNKDAFTFTLAPAETDKSGRPQASIGLDVQPRIMASLCKSYSYDEIPELWVARSVFKNTGGQDLTDYRVRFRIPEYTDDWSEWTSTSQIIAGQSVVDTFFPILDAEKTARIDGTRRAVVEMECEYTTGGKVINEKKSKKIEILGRNEAILYGPLEPYVLASFVTKDDPVVQRVAAMVASQVPGGINAAGKLAIEPDAPLAAGEKYDRNVNAKLFMKELYRFMLHNKIVYQTPPDSGDVQHVKFARDVILNRAGTCVDLAIFYASVCEAVGLNPTLYLPPGHCFPGIVIFPDPKDPKDEEEDVEVETTMLGPADNFLFSRAYAMLEVADTAPDKRVQREVFLPDYRARSVHSLELPPLSPDVLEKAGITPANGDFELTGTFKCVAVSQLDGKQYTTTCHFANGRCDYSIADWTGNVVFQDAGAFTLDDGHYVFKGQVFQDEGTVTWVDRDHYKYKGEKSTNPASPLGIEYLCSRAN